MIRGRMGRTLRKSVAMPDRNAIDFCNDQTPAIERLLAELD